jgi:serine/threonine protein kinase
LARRAPEEDSVKIIDFGLAKLIDSSTGPEAAKLTKTGTVLGSVYYMSPEQAQGHQLDERSDIYSCGCVLFEMLTGEKPFDADTPVGVMYKHCNCPLPGLSDTGYGKNYASHFDLLCRKATEKDPQMRYHTMNEMLRDIEALQTGKKYLLEPALRGSRWISSNREFLTKWKTKSGGLIALCIIGFFIALLLVMKQSNSAAQEAKRAFAAEQMKKKD